MNSEKHTPEPWKVGAPPPNGEQTLGTGDIEQLPGTVADIAQTVVALKKQNDELLAALKGIAFATAPEPDDGSYHENAYHLATEAIAKAGLPFANAKIKYDELLAASKGLLSTVMRLRIAYVTYPGEGLEPNPSSVSECWEAVEHFRSAIAACEAQS